jgi:hypothetical protein
VTFARRLFFVVVTISLMTEGAPYAADSLAQVGWYLHTDLKKWAPVGIAFTVIELSLITCALCWFLRSASARRRFAFIRGRLLAPIVAFGVAVAIGVLWGMIQGGVGPFPDIYALFEIRGFGVLIFAYFLVGMLVRDERDLSTLVWCALIACMGLAVENLLRYYLLLGRGYVNDLAYDHDDSVVLVFGVVLCAALFAFRGTPGQRRFALALLPLSILCLEVMHRRAAFAILPVGLGFLAITFYRLRPKQFWRVVPLLTLLFGIYLTAYWNNTGTLGQPARAIRSQFSPDPRDEASDQYRTTEHADIVANIRSARIMGLGFGQMYTFYYPLPDLSFWQFWHYTSHNAVLWVWMDGGVLSFFTFFWLLGSGAYQGGQELAARREAWSLTQLRLRRPRRSRHPRSISTKKPVAIIASDAPVAAPWEAPPTARARQRAGPSSTAFSGSAIALIAAGVCQVAVQVTYSYVDLGLTGDRTMLLLGILLGVMGRTYISTPVRQRRKLGASRPAKHDLEALPSVEGGSGGGETDVA